MRAWPGLPSHVKLDPYRTGDTSAQTMTRGLLEHPVCE